MSKLSSSDEQQFVADAEAARDDPDSPLLPVTLRLEKDAQAVLSLSLPFKTVTRLQQVSTIRGITLAEALDRALDALMGDTELRGPMVGATRPTAPIEVTISASAAVGEGTTADQFTFYYLKRSNIGSVPSETMGGMSVEVLPK